MIGMKEIVEEVEEIEEVSIDIEMTQEEGERGLEVTISEISNGKKNN